MKYCTLSRYFTHPHCQSLTDACSKLFLIVLSVLVVGCSSGGESTLAELRVPPPTEPKSEITPPEQPPSSDSSKIPSRAGFTLYDIDDTALNFKKNYFWQNIYDYPDTVAISRDWTFTLDEHVISFALVLEGENAGDQFIKQTGSNIYVTHQSAISRVITPDGTVLALEDYVFCQEHLCSMVIPNTLDGEAIALAGQWRVQIAVAVDDIDTFSEDVADYQIKVLYRSVADKDEADESKIYIQPYLSSTLIDKDMFNTQVVTQLSQLAAANGLPIEILDVKVLSTDDYSAVSYRFADPKTSAMLKAGNRFAVNVYYIDELLDLPLGYQGVLGFSGGIPGPLGVQSANNGVMLPIGAFYRSDVGLSDADIENIASTSLHEIGHFLGLFHTTEATGNIFDLMSDTPECDIRTYDKNKNGLISLFECRGVDDGNIMFFQTDASTDQTFSPQQIEVLKRSPIARISPPRDEK